MAQDSPPPTNGASNGRHNGSDERPPRLPRWTRQEILVLIQGKKVAESRVRRGRSASFGAPAATAVEPKWASVASYCRRHGVDRGPVQCRKRWSNLSGDFKKIKEWEARVAEGASRPSDSFWAMRADARREKKLPGFFDREVYDILNQGGVGPTKEGVELAAVVAAVVEEEEVIFDSGRAAAAEDGLFSDSEQPASPEKAAVAAEDEESPVTDATPISERQYNPFDEGHLDAGVDNEQQPDAGTGKASGSPACRKRKRVSPESVGLPNLQDQLMDVLEQNSKMLLAQLEAQNINCQLDRDQRKDHTDGLLSVLGKLADALGRIADKL